MEGRKDAPVASFVGEGIDKDYDPPAPRLWRASKVCGKVGMRP